MTAPNDDDAATLERRREIVTAVTNVPNLQDLFNLYQNSTDKDLGFIDSDSGMNLLFWAVQRKPPEEAYEIVKYLVEVRKVCDPALIDGNMQTAVFFAAREGATRCIEYLTEKGCPPHHVDMAGQTALFYACREGRDDSVTLLENLNVPINHTDRIDQTALFYAAREGRESTVEVMLNLGADPKIRDFRKRCAHYYAHNHASVAALLKSACSRVAEGAAPTHNRKHATRRESRCKCQLQVAIEVNGHTRWLFATEAQILDFEAKFPQLAAWSRIASHDYEPLDGFRMTWSQVCLEIVSMVSNFRNGWMFSRPVDPVLWNCPDYYQVIAEPRDLSLVKNKLRKMEYVSIKEFFRDMTLIFTNCFKYNAPTSTIYQSGKEIEAFWISMYDHKGLEQLKQDEEALNAVFNIPSPNVPPPYVALGDHRPPIEPTTEDEPTQC